MFWLEVIVAVAVLVGVAIVVSTGGGLDDVDTDTRDVGLPTDRLLRSDDIARLRFRAISGFWGGLRGYRFDDVDRTMAKVEASLRAHEERYAALVGPAADEPPHQVAGSEQVRSDPLRTDAGDAAPASPPAP
ncbi:MAG TPA: hypothetical protein VFT62_05215 [Mycobacteriales bacterium]|nr:hypothetical protein [Mycobacteriales bacterium]